jgi:anti-sigma B factor antagonist
LQQGLLQQWQLRYSVASNQALLPTVERRLEVTGAQVRSEQRNRPVDGTLTVETYCDGDGTTVVQLYGEFDLASVATFEAELACAEAELGPLVIDLSGLDFIDSTGIGQLLAAHNRAESDGRELAFLKGQPPVEKVLRLTGLNEILTFGG